MKPITTPYWDDLIFSIKSEVLSTKLVTQPGFKFLRLTITEHSTGNQATIPEYPCRYNHSPSIEELLSFLLDKSELYVDALNSYQEPHCYMLEKFKLKDCGQGLTIFLQTRECFKTLCSILRGTGVDIDTLRVIVAKKSECK